MSKLDIKYIDNSRNIRDITAIEIEVTDKFLKLTNSANEIHYIPLMNIKEFGIKGANQLRGDRL